jgi:coenzyme F420-0:L-glutamate ligase/coenzyme F420-1:gamma-L-glutamate ligase
VKLAGPEREFIERHRVAHLATASAAGAPHVVPICYACVGDALYFVVDEKPKRTRMALKRLRNIMANPRVAVVFDDYEEDWRRLAYLLVHGEAQRVTEPAEFDQVLEALRARYPQYRSMPLAFASHPMIRVVPQRWHSWRATVP